jgi:formiminotetrahydrofolate cyclodeaminase
LDRQGKPLARAAVLGALMNAKFNLASLKDRNLAIDLETKIAHFKQSALDKEAEILEALKI